jgi:polar amino acid transport system substrate-binding protein
MKPARRAIKAAALVLLALTAAAGCAAPAATEHAAAGRSATRHTGAQSAAPARVTSARAAAVPSCNPDASSLAPNGGPTVAPGSFAAKIKAKGLLVAGVDQTTYHFGFLNPLDGKIEGFDVDMADAVARAIFGNGYQNHIQFKAILNSQRIQDLQDDSVDIVADTMTINCQRLQQIDFSSVYDNAQAQLLVPKNSPATGLQNLKGQNVCAVTGSDDIAIIQRYHAKPVEPTYWTDCLVDLQQGQVGGIVTDNSILQGLVAQDPFTKIVGGPLEPEPYGLGISKQHPDFVRFVNAVLAQIESDGTWESDYKHWVSSAGQPPPVPQYAG